MLVLNNGLFSAGNLDVEDSLPHITTEEKAPEDHAEAEMNSVLADEAGKEIDVAIEQVTVGVDTFGAVNSEYQKHIENIDKMEVEGVEVEQEVFALESMKISNLIAQASGCLSAGLKDSSVVNHYNAGIESVKNPSLQSYKEGVLGLKEFLTKIRKKIVNFFKWIWSKLKQFWGWLFGGNKVAEATESVQVSSDVVQEANKNGVKEEKINEVLQSENVKKKIEEVATKVVLGATTEVLYANKKGSPSNFYKEVYNLGSVTIGCVEDTAKKLASAGENANYEVIPTTDEAFEGHSELDKQIIGSLNAVVFLDLNLGLASRLSSLKGFTIAENDPTDEFFNNLKSIYDKASDLSTHLKVKQEKLRKLFSEGVDASFVNFEPVSQRAKIMLSDSYDFKLSPSSILFHNKKLDKYGIILLSEVSESDFGISVDLDGFNKKVLAPLVPMLISDKLTKYVETTGSEMEKTGSGIKNQLERFEKSSAHVLALLEKGNNSSAVTPVFKCITSGAKDTSDVLRLPYNGLKSLETVSKIVEEAAIEAADELGVSKQKMKDARKKRKQKFKSLKKK